MKIIRPIEINDDLFASNAPDDSYSAWQPEGTDFSTDWSTFAMHAAGDDLYLINTYLTYDINSSNIRHHNLSTLVKSVPSIVDADIDPSYVSLSPNGSYLAVIGSKSGDGTYNHTIRVYNASTGATLFTEEKPIMYASTYSCCWADDSSWLAFAGFDGGGMSSTSIKFIETTGWTVDNVSAQIGTISGFTSDPYYKTFPLSICNVGSTHAVLAMKVQYLSPAVYRCYLMKAASSDGSTISLLTSSVSSSSELESITAIGYNPETTEILANATNVGLESYNISDLSDASNVPSGYSGVAVAQIIFAPGAGDELLIRTLSSQPYVRRYVASTYVATTPSNLDGIVTGTIKEVFYSTDYYVLKIQSGGFSLIARSDDSLVEESNPSVLTDDIYIYDKNIYQALSNNSDRPDLGAAAVPPTWILVSAINRLKMFDGKIGTQTMANGSLNVSIAPQDIVEGVALFNVIADTVQVISRHGAVGVFYDDSLELWGYPYGSTDYIHKFELDDLRLVSATQVAFISIYDSNPSYNLLLSIVENTGVYYFHLQAIDGVNSISVNLTTVDNALNISGYDNAGTGQIEVGDFAFAFDMDSGEYFFYVDGVLTSYGVSGVSNFNLSNITDFSLFEAAPTGLRHSDFRLYRNNILIVDCRATTSDYTVMVNYNSTGFDMEYVSAPGDNSHVQAFIMEDFDSGVVTVDSGDPKINYSDLVFLGLNDKDNPTVTITLTSNSGDVYIGQAVVGDVIEVGEAQMGVSTGIIDFSIKEQDEFGNFSITERGYSKRAEFPVVIDTDSVGLAQKQLANLRVTPAVYIGDENREETIIYGYYRDFEFVLAGLGYSEYSLLVEGL